MRSFPFSITQLALSFPGLTFTSGTAQRATSVASRTSAIGMKTLLRVAVQNIVFDSFSEGLSFSAVFPGVRSQNSYARHCSHLERFRTRPDPPFRSSLDFHLFLSPMRRRFAPRLRVSALRTRPPGRSRDRPPGAPSRSGMRAMLRVNTSHSASSASPPAISLGTRSTLPSQMPVPAQAQI